MSFDSKGYRIPDREIRGRIITIEGVKVELVPHRPPSLGIVFWDAFLVDDSPSDRTAEAPGSPITSGEAQPTRRDLVSWLKSPYGRRHVRQAAGLER